MKYIKILFLGLLSACSSPTDRLTDGMWRGVFQTQDAEIPFLFEIKAADTENPVVTLINGEERVDLTDVTYRNDSVMIPIKTYDAVLEAKVDGERMSGRLVKLYSSWPDGRVPFTAQKGNVPRFENTGEQATMSLDGRWEITVPERDMAKQVGVFTQKANGYLTAWFQFFEIDFFIKAVVSAVNKPTEIFHRHIKPLGQFCYRALYRIYL